MEGTAWCHDGKGDHRLVGDSPTATGRPRNEEPRGGPSGAWPALDKRRLNREQKGNTGRGPTRDGATGGRHRLPSAKKTGSKRTKARAKRKNRTVRAPRNGAQTEHPRRNTRNERVNQAPPQSTSNQTKEADGNRTENSTERNREETSNWD